MIDSRTCWYSSAHSIISHKVASLSLYYHYYHGYSSCDLHSLNFSTQYAPTCLWKLQFNSVPEEVPRTWRDTSDIVTNNNMAQHEYTSERAGEKMHSSLPPTGFLKVKLLDFLSQTLSSLAHMYDLKG